jgi:hypothetical protein
MVNGLWREGTEVGLASATATRSGSTAVALTYADHRWPRPPPEQQVGPNLPGGLRHLY